MSRLLHVAWLLQILLTNAEVIVLDTSNFDTLTEAGKASAQTRWFVMFHAPWCGHCRALKPTWEQLAADTGEGPLLDGQLKLRNVASIDATNNSMLATRFQVQGYPTLLLLAKGSAYRYQGGRDLAAMQAFLGGGYVNSPAEPVYGYASGFLRIFVSELRSMVADLKPAFSSAFSHSAMCIRCAHCATRHEVLFVSAAAFPGYQPRQ